MVKLANMKNSYIKFFLNRPRNRCAKFQGDYMKTVGEDSFLRRKKLQRFKVTISLVITHKPPNSTRDNFGLQ